VGADGVERYGITVSRRVTGGAQKRWANGYMIHHVTMAYDIDAFKMNEVLRIGMEKIRDKGTRSVVKRVDPMRSQTGMAREEWVHRIP